MATAERHSTTQKTFTFLKKIKNFLPLGGTKKKPKQVPSESKEKVEAKPRQDHAHPARRRKKNLKAKAQGQKHRHHKHASKTVHPKSHQAETKDSAPPEFSHVNPYHDVDRAHSPGHRKLNVRGEFQQATGEKVQVQHTARDRMAPADQVHRMTSQDRSNGFVGSVNRRRDKSGH